MLPNRNELYLLRYISGADKNELMQVIANLGFKPRNRENNAVYQIIDELNFADYFKEKAVKWTKKIKKF